MARHFQPAAYAALDPQQVLDALDAVGLSGDGRVLQLNSYENRVFQVFLDDGRAVVAKFYRPGRWSDAQIVEEHAFALELAEAEVPVVAPLALAAVPQRSLSGALRLLGEPATLACLDGDGAPPLRWAVSPRCAGREPELSDPATLRRLGGFIGRLHAVGRRRPFAHRHRFDARADGEQALATLRAGGHLTPAEAPAWEQAATQALAQAVAAFERLPGLASLRLHGDCHLGNILWTEDGGAHVVDLDDAIQGPAMQDLWMLVAGDRAGIARQLDTVLAGYEAFCDFDPRQRALIEPLRTLRMLRHSAWLAARWTDPTFPLNFPHFGSAAYWSQQTTQLREQIELTADG